MSKSTKNTTKKSSKKVVKNAPAPKAITHNKSFPIVKTSRTKMVQILNNTKGKFFTSTHVDKDGNPRTMNAIRYKGAPGELGYIMVYSVRDKGIRNLNPQTITDLSFGGVHYVANRK